MPPQVKMAEDIDFKYPTRRACAWEISHFCKGVPHGHARVIRCLQVRTAARLLFDKYRKFLGFSITTHQPKDTRWAQAAVN
jgi:hypothetical protein